MMKWVLVTGGVYSGIGKGCLSSVFGRLLKQTGSLVQYLKCEPCFQQDISDVPNTIFGEVATLDNKTYYDGDVARAFFYIPEQNPKWQHHLSLGQANLVFIESSAGRNNLVPRFAEISEVYFRCQDENCDILVVEVGGTAGEPEHAIVCGMLEKAFGLPSIHLHLTTVVKKLDNYISTKPAQISICSLRNTPDIVFIRTGHDGVDFNPIRSQLARDARITEVLENQRWPERAFYKSLLVDSIIEKVENTLGLTLRPDPIFEVGQGKQDRQVVIIHDGAGPEGYQSLRNRLNVWSRGVLNAVWQEDPNFSANVSGIIRIGEQVPARIDSNGYSIPLLNIVPIEFGANSRDFNFRPDWHGYADSPEGEVYEFIKKLSLGDAGLSNKPKIPATVIV